MAIHGNTITFPHNMSSIVKQITEFPVNVSVLPEIIKVIFIGKTMPQKKNLKGYFVCTKASSDRCSGFLAGKPSHVFGNSTEFKKHKKYAK